MDGPVRTPSVMRDRPREGLHARPRSSPGRWTALVTRSRTRRGAWWVAYAVCSVIVLLGALAWISLVEVLRPRAGPSCGRAPAPRRIEDKRVCVWRSGSMDSWLALRCSRSEAARPHYEYEAYYRLARQRSMVTSVLKPAGRRPKWLDAARHCCHLQLGACSGCTSRPSRGRTSLTSPQVLGGNFRDHAEYCRSNYLKAEQIDDNDRRLLQERRATSVEAGRARSRCVAVRRADVVRSELTAPTKPRAGSVEPRSTPLQQVAEQVEEPGRRDQSRRGEERSTPRSRRRRQQMEQTRDRDH